VHWEGGVNWGESGHKVFFESPNGAFRGVASMTVRRNQLISDIIGREKFFKAVDASLLRVWSFGLKPLTVSYWCMLSYALTHSKAVLDFIGTTLM
jgi:hypothetical protein